ncbi:TlpA family protein disulfide reductase, partial [candidate division KSB1 bacterium]|nr:TlpA family protein disulfide reductase [candidate division KSB1 bacterium]NIS22760.1 TlpA family protein disulfide reductase [candidate division KSB1 bacterium]NIT69391.1 TlpA family protein disulfide reductase [candidate division KSB1 bacterium]NIU23268.1 TlpA family protein disulfide reductase [candidate division KSB1 bacterium]NIU89387.1 redoxin domain-containing protein [candidate division KSB1 bacterium]
KLLDGNRTVSRQDLLGQFYLFGFWWSGCPSCVSQIANLEKAYEKYGDKNFTILSLSLDKDIETVVEFREKNFKMPWLNAHVRDQWQNRFTASLMVHDVPKIFLVSPEGVILAAGRELIGENLEKTLSKYLRAN